MKYFAYGMNLNPYYMRGAKKLGAAALHDWVLKFHRFCDIQPSPGDVVLGGLWEIDEGMLYSLDGREGFPNLYLRFTEFVEFGNEVVPAIIYSMPPGKAFFSPDEYYIQDVKEGYLFFGLEESFLVDALDLETRKDSERRNIQREPREYFTSV